MLTTLLVALTGMAGQSARAVQEPEAKAVSVFVGCYELRVGSAWRSAIRLDAERRAPPFGRPDRETWYSLAPDVVANHELPFLPAWRPVGTDSLILNWFDGFDGPIVVLKRQRDGWVGTHRRVSDIAEQSSKPERAVLRPKACPSR
jgi:hypothetical protein